MINKICRTFVMTLLLAQAACTPVNMDASMLDYSYVPPMTSNTVPDFGLDD